MSTHEVTFTAATAIVAEGQRVGIVTCMTCGAAVLIDGRDSADATVLHRRWHERTAGGHVA